MRYLMNRLPTRREAFLVFTVMFVVIYSWSVISFFNYLPGWMLYLDGWTIAGVFAYSQVFTLFESLLALGLLVLVAALLPRRLFRERFVAQGVAAFLLAAACAAALHFTGTIPLWPSKRLIFGAAAYLLGVAAAGLALHKFTRIKALIESLVDRLVVLVYLYLPLVAVSAVIILVRNVF